MGEMEENTKRGRKTATATSDETGIVSCLRNERVVVKHVPRETAMVHNPKHILYGGMADTAIRVYTVPMKRDGTLTNVLTDSEKEFLEDYLGLEANALSIYKRGYDEQGNPKNYWSNFQVRLDKTDNYLDLSKADDYIKYKVLLANDDFIAPSLDVLQSMPKVTYEFVIIRENEEAKASKKRLNSTMEAYMEFGKIRDDSNKLRVILETIDGRPMSKTTKPEVLEDRINSLIQADAKMFLKVAQDKYLDTKILIKLAIEAGIISNRGGLLYMREDGSPLCNSGDPTLSVAAAYLNEPKHQELKFAIEAKLKNK